jgi:hypothetical protein
MPVQAQKNLLSDIFRIRPISENTEGCSQYLGFAPAKNFVKRACRFARDLAHERCF